MAGKKSFELTGSTVMLLAGAVALAGALYWVVFLGHGADDQAATSEDAPAPSLGAQDDGASVEESAQVETDTAKDGVAAAEPEQEPDSETVTAAEPEAEADIEAAAAADTETATETQPETQAETQPETQAAPEVAEAPVGPSFDVVRIDPQGSAVIAGEAAPGAVVILLADGVEVGRTKADLTGKFVALFDMPPSDAPRSLSAQMIVDGAEAVASAGTVLIAPVRPVVVAQVAPDPKPEEEAEAEAPAAPEVVADADVKQAEPAREDAETVVAQSAPDPVATAQPEAESQAEAEAPKVAAPAERESPTIVLADDSGVRVLQGAAQPAVPSQSPQVAANLVIDTITYDDSGDVALSGRGQGAGFARVYLDGKPVQTVQIAPDGTWRTPLPDVDAGVYRLRIDELDAEGAVTSRVETPFQREEPEIVAEAAGRPNVVTVQKGFTLWAIAEDRFGSGVEYVRVYEANRDLIRDPDLIYPGQVFAIPEG